MERVVRSMTAAEANDMLSTFLTNLRNTHATLGPASGNYISCLATVRECLHAMRAAGYTTDIAAARGLLGVTAQPGLQVGGAGGVGEVEPSSRGGIEVGVGGAMQLDSAAEAEQSRERRVETQEGGTEMWAQTVDELVRQMERL